MTRAYGLGPLPGTSIAQAVDVIASETGDTPHLPQLPDRGLGSDLIGRTVAMLEAVHVDRGPRSWVMTQRPQLLMRDTWDRLERDMDECEEAFGTQQVMKVQAAGPWTLAASIELASGHRVITDQGASRDLTEALIDGLISHCADIARRFGAEVLVQLDEPLLPDVINGTLPGAHRFDPIAPVHPKDAAERLATVVEGLPQEVLLNQTGYPPHLDVAVLAGVDVAQVSVDKIRGTAAYDALGEAVAGGLRIGLGVTDAGDEVDELGDNPREKAIQIARLWDELALDPQLMRQMDVHPRGRLQGSLVEVSRAYAMAQAVATMLERDAGDL